MVVEDIRRRPGRPVSGGRGDLLVPVGESGRFFRILHADGSRTPNYRVDASLQVLGGFRGGFLAYAWRLEDGPRLARHWVRISTEGEITPASETLQAAAPVQRGDLVYRSPRIDRTEVFRPSTGERFRLPVPVRGRLWEQDDLGWLWSCPDRGSTGMVRWSNDGARSWSTTRYRLLVDATPSSRWTLFCLARGGQMALMAFLDDNPVGFVSWEMSGTPRVTARLTRFGSRLNVYAAGQLFDGRLVFGTDRPGLMVQGFEGPGDFVHRKGPAVLESNPDRTRDGLVWTGARKLYLTDDGEHWRVLDPLADE